MHYDMLAHCTNWLFIFGEIIGYNIKLCLIYAVKFFFKQSGTRGMDTDEPDLHWAK